MAFHMKMSFHSHGDRTHFHMNEGFCTRPRFEKEAQDNSEIACSYICPLNLVVMSIVLSWILPREARRAEGPPSVARFINLSRGVRARIAKGGQISIGRYIFRWCPHSCLATKPNRDRWQLCTLMFLRCASSFLACFAAFIWVLICLFIVCEQASNAWLNKWLKIHSGGDLQLKLSVNADLKFSANNEGERVDDKKAVPELREVLRVTYF